MLKTASKLVSADQIITPVTLADDLTLSTGNLVIGTSGKGIDFSAASHTGGMTSELLDDYEEGDWTPVLSIGGPITYTSQVGRYTKIGRQVTLYYSIVVATASGGAGAVQMTLPFACNGVDVDKQGYPGPIGLQTTSNAGITRTGFYDDSATAFFYGPGTVLIGTEVLASDILSGTVTYFTAT